MAVQDQMWHDITWEEQKYFDNVTNPNSGERIRALYTVDKNGKPEARYLTEAGKKYFGVEDDLTKRMNGAKERWIEAEKEAAHDRMMDKAADGFSAAICSIPKFLCNTIIDAVPGLRCLIDTSCCFCA